MADILVVDDEVRIRDLVRCYLEHEGQQVLSAAADDGEALEVAARAEVDLVIFDLRPTKPCSPRKLVLRVATMPRRGRAGGTPDRPVSLRPRSRSGQPARRAESCWGRLSARGRP